MNNIRKALITLSIILVVCLVISGFLIYESKSYYPDLPFEGSTKEEVIQKVYRNHNSIIKITSDDLYSWYIYQGNQLDGRNELIKRLNTNGWEYKEQMGSGSIFMKNNEESIITSQQWTRKYVIYQVPHAMEF
ncbi:hypothetical protein [Paenibacillus soyae]|uniref:Uncharacterized protein n=1 Tax=Paenibacillus soyae TaxID=2969249 RepID=A0A9X2MMF0_9BACL|nr:hypothetical protein [Paenibacillus soyae]MCR2802799.1 hypothetical protein [Paenibacillus soyae]